MHLIKVFTFDAAHKLPNVPANHKCGRLHGHTFRVEIHLSGPVDAERGWVIDFADVKNICQSVLSRLDHNYLNDIEGLENPTSENIATWLWARLLGDLPMLKRIVVYESPDSGAAYEGD